MNAFMRAGRIGVSVGLLLLTGCADVNWERAFYDGFQRCPAGRSAQSGTCGPGPSYEQYRQDRQQLQPEGKASRANNPIDEKQL
jgi:hypothetical protein